MAGRRPEAVVEVDAGVGEARVRLDLSPAGRAFRPAALLPIGRACAEWAATGPRWIAAPDTVQVDGLAPEAARGLVAELLRVAADRRWTAHDPADARPGAPD